MIITISREFGSGGREIAKRLADILKFDYYDKEIITEIANKSQLNENYIESFYDNNLISGFNLKLRNSFSSFNSLYQIQNTIFSEQRKVILEIANRSKNAIIVGRNADEILKDLAPFKIFVSASMDSKIERCINKTEDKTISVKTIKKQIKLIDKSRANLCEMYSNYKWGAKENYDLIINTTNKDIKTVSQALANYLKEFLANI